jgi:hypothetical protein
MRRPQNLKLALDSGLHLLVEFFHSKRLLASKT